MGQANNRGRVMAMLSGVSVKPGTTAEAKALIGKKVIYLQKKDIDQTGRGYFFPRGGVVAAVVRGQIAINDDYNFIGSIKSIVEMVLADGADQ